MRNLARKGTLRRLEQTILSAALSAEVRRLNSLSGCFQLESWLFFVSLKLKDKSGDIMQLCIVDTSEPKTTIVV